MRRLGGTLSKLRPSGRRVEGLTLSIFHESFLLTPGFSPESKEISAPPPCGFLIEIYLSYENWSNETFRKKESEKRPGCSTYKWKVSIKV
jgi:hypothetical protein